MGNIAYGEMVSKGEDYLCHYGRLGMKWGQHIFGQSRSSSLTARSKAKAKEQKRAERKERREERIQKRKDERVRRRSIRLGQKDIAKLSDEELRQQTERLNLEVAYRTAYDAAHPGRKHVADALKTLGSQLVKDPNTYINAAKGLDYLINRMTPEVRLEKEKKATADAQREHQLKLKNIEVAESQAQRAHQDRMDKRDKTYEYIKDTRKYNDNAASRRHEIKLREIDNLNTADAEEWARRRLREQGLLP